MRVEPRARGRPAQRDLPNPGKRAANALGPQPDLRRVPAELLPKRHRDRVHQVRAPGLDDVGELLSLSLECGRELVHRGQQVARGLVEGGQMDGGREDIVRRLAHVHVVIGVGAVAREVRDHLANVP